MKENAAWFRQGERTSALGIRILLALERAGGGTLFRWAALPVLLGYWLADPSLRRASLGWLEAVDRETGFLKGRRPGAAEGLTQLAHFAESMLDKIKALEGRPGLPRLLIEGEDVFRGDGPKTGAVVLTAHTGCWELLAAEGLRRTEHPIVILQHTANSRRFNAILEARRRARPEAFANLSSLEVSGRPEEAAALALRVSEALAEGAYVVIAGDRIPIASARSAVRLPFMGREAPFPTGGALLALLARAPLRTMISARIDRPGEPRTYRVRFRSIDEAPSAGRRERRAWLESAMRRYGAALEADLRDSPYDWFNFYDFWNPGC